MDIFLLTISLLFLDQIFLSSGFVNPIPVAPNGLVLDQVRPRIDTKPPSDKFTHSAASIPTLPRAHLDIPSSFDALPLQQQREPETEECKEKIDWTSENGQEQLLRLQKAMNADEDFQKYISHIFTQQNFPEKIVEPVFQSAKYIYNIIQKQGLVFYIQGFQVLSITATNSTSIQVHFKPRKGAEMVITGAIAYVRRDLESKMPERTIELEETMGLDDLDMSMSLDLEVCDCLNNPLSSFSQGAKAFTGFTGSNLYKFGVSVGRIIARVEGYIQHYIDANAEIRRRMKIVNPEDHEEEEEVQSLVEELYPSGIIKSFLWKALNYHIQGTATTILDKHRKSFLGTCN